MPEPATPSPFARTLVGALKQVIATDGDAAPAALTHRLLIRPASRDRPIPYTVHLAPDDQGTFLVTCREIPDVLTFGEDEEEALKMARYAILEALGSGPGAPDRAY